MARPNPKTGEFETQIREQQQNRHKTLIAFGNLLASQKVKQGVRENDDMFASIVHLAIQEYGLKQARIADALEVSPAAVGRWSKGNHLPKAHYRPSVVETIQQLIEAEASKVEDGQPIGRVRSHR